MGASTFRVISIATLFFELMACFSCTSKNEKRMVDVDSSMRMLIPPLEYIEEIVADCEYRTSDSSYTRVLPFRVPKDDWGEVISILSASKAIEPGSEKMFCGTLKMRTQRGETFEVWLLELDRMYYTLIAPNGCRSHFVADDDGRQILNVIAALYAESKDGKRPNGM